MVKNEIRTIGSIDTSAVASMAEKIRTDLEKELGPAASSITVRLSGTLKNLKVDFAGPVEIVQRAKEVLGLRRSLH